MEKDGEKPKKKDVDKDRKRDRNRDKGPKKDGEKTDREVSSASLENDGFNKPKSKEGILRFIDLKKVAFGLT